MRTSAHYFSVQHSGPRKTGASTSGFTLLELSIVLIIIALVTGMAITSGVSVISTARLSATQQKMATIEKSLMQYRSANDRLPCPGDLTLPTTNTYYGLEAGSANTCTVGTGACTGTVIQGCSSPTAINPAADFIGNGVTNINATAAEGALPALTLGLPSDFMVDGWGNRFRYAVDVSMTANGAFRNVSISCNNGAITVMDGNGNTRSKNSIYALLSHGANGHGAYTSNGAVVNSGSVNTNELINCHCNSTGATTTTGFVQGTPTTAGTMSTNSATYIQSQPTVDSTNSLDNFDDVVTYKERWQMQTTWDKTGTMGCGSDVVAFASYYNPTTVYFYNLTGNTITGTAGSIPVTYSGTTLAYSPDGTTFYLSPAYTPIYVYAVNNLTGQPTGIVLWNLGQSDATNPDPVVSSDGNFVFRSVFWGDGGYIIAFQKTTNGYSNQIGVPTVSPGGNFDPAYASVDPYANHVASAAWGDGSHVIPTAPLIYKRSGSSFSQLAGQPGTPFADTNTSTKNWVMYSPDGTYLYGSDPSDTTAHMRAWYLSATDTYTSVASIASAFSPEMSEPGQIAVSPNNVYVAFATADGSSPYASVYKRSGSGASTTFASVALASPGSAVNDLAFTHDGNYLVLGLNGTPYIQAYLINYSANTFTALPAPALTPPGPAQSIAVFR